MAGAPTDRPRPRRGVFDAALDALRGRRREPEVEVRLVDGSRIRVPARDVTGRGRRRGPWSPPGLGV